MMEGTVIKGGIPSIDSSTKGTNASTVDHGDERPLHGNATGQYEMDISQRFGNLEIAVSDDEYDSDEFYSDDFEEEEADGTG